MTIDRLVEYRMGNIVLEKSDRKGGKNARPRPFYKKSCFQINSLKCYCLSQWRATKGGVLPKDIKTKLLTACCDIV